MRDPDQEGPNEATRARIARVGMIAIGLVVIVAAVFVAWRSWH
jgi:hypothetical protein